MIPYFALLGMWLLGAVQFSTRASVAYEKAFYAVALAVTILMVGLRDEVGADWFAYDAMYRTIVFQSLSDAMRFTEPAYGFLNWVGARLDLGVYLANLGCAIVFVLGLSSLARRQRQPWLAMTVAVPYLVIVVGMGYTRQAAAIGGVCWAIAKADEDTLLGTVAKVGLAALFHKTAVLFLPILLAPLARRNLLLGLVGGVLFAGLAMFILASSSDLFISSYVTSDYQSGGAVIRVAMNVVAAAIFLALRNRFTISSSERLIWTVSSLLAVVCVAALVLTSSSVGVDRVALFLIPLQVFVYSNLPLLFRGGTRISLTLVCIAYCVAIEYVYFFHASYSYAWVPYRNLLIPGL